MIEKVRFPQRGMTESEKLDHRFFAGTAVTKAAQAAAAARADSKEENPVMMKARLMSPTKLDIQITVRPDGTLGSAAVVNGGSGADAADADAAAAAAAATNKFSVDAQANLMKDPNSPRIRGFSKDPLPEQFRTSGSAGNKTKKKRKAAAANAGAKSPGPSRKQKPGTKGDATPLAVKLEQWPGVLRGGAEGSAKDDDDAAKAAAVARRVNNAIIGGSEDGEDGDDVNDADDDTRPRRPRPHFATDTRVSAAKRREVSAKATPRLRSSGRTPRGMAVNRALQGKQFRRAGREGESPAGNERIKSPDNDGRDRNGNKLFGFSPKPRAGKPSSSRVNQQAGIMTPNSGTEGRFATRSSFQKQGAANDVKNAAAFLYIPGQETTEKEALVARTRERQSLQNAYNLRGSGYYDGLAKVEAQDRAMMEKYDPETFAYYEGIASQTSKITNRSSQPDVQLVMRDIKRKLYAEEGQSRRCKPSDIDSGLDTDMRSYASSKAATARSFTNPRAAAAAAAGAGTAAHLTSEPLMVRTSGSATAAGAQMLPKGPSQAVAGGRPQKLQEKVQPAEDSSSSLPAPVYADEYDSLSTPAEDVLVAVPAIPTSPEEDDASPADNGPMPASTVDDEPGVMPGDELVEDEPLDVYELEDRTPGDDDVRTPEEVVEDLKKAQSKKKTKKEKKHVGTAEAEKRAGDPMEMMRIKPLYVLLYS